MFPTVGLDAACPVTRAASVSDGFSAQYIRLGAELRTDDGPDDANAIRSMIVSRLAWSRFCSPFGVGTLKRGNRTTNLNAGLHSPTIRNRTMDWRHYWLPNGISRPTLGRFTLKIATLRLALVLRSLLALVAGGIVKPPIPPFRDAVQSGAEPNW
jgi:hypothetical protein